ncbi:MAG: rubrerythrin family protein [Desulfurococcaceae archaeon TW002]
MNELRPLVKEALLSAYAGESMAQSRYRAFEEVAEREGFKNVARLFRAIAFAEQVHARNHLMRMASVMSDQKACGGAPIGLGNTSQNLALAITGEEFEVKEMYPTYIAIAEFHKDGSAEKTFRWALEAEKIHAELYRKAKEHVDKGEDMPLEDKVWICPVCGHTHVGPEAPEKCPVCGVPRNKYIGF